MVIKNFQLENGPGGCPSWGIFKGINRREILGWESAMPIGDSGKCTAANKDWLSTSVPFLGCCSQNSIICQVFAKQKQKQNRWLLCTKTDWTKKGELRPGVCILTPAVAGAASNSLPGLLPKPVEVASVICSLPLTPPCCIDVTWGKIWQEARPFYSHYKIHISSTFFLW